MKKTFLKSSYKLKIFNDGSSAYIWIHPWKGWIPLTSKDISTHLQWNPHIKNQKIKNKTGHLQKYAKKLR